MLRSHGSYAPAVVSTLVASVLVTIILMIASPSSVAATSDEDCWECMSGVGEHEWFEGDWHTDSENNGLFEVSPPDGQHASDGEDLCTDSHVFMCPEYEEEDAETIVQALDRGDLDAARNAYLRVVGVVTLNVERNALQIVSCTDPEVVVAHFSVAVPMVVASLDASILEHRGES